MAGAAIAPRERLSAEAAAEAAAAAATTADAVAHTQAASLQPAPASPRADSATVTAAAASKMGSDSAVAAAVAAAEPRMALPLPAWLTSEGVREAVAARPITLSARVLLNYGSSGSSRRDNAGDSVGAGGLAAAVPSSSVLPAAPPPWLE